MTIKEKIKKYIEKKVTHPDHAFNVQEDDIFLVSYPKSGNTWMRFLLANIFSNGKEVTLYNLDSFVPSIYISGREKILKKMPLKIFKTHSFFRAKFGRNKIIYLVRDPRDILVSYYFYRKKILNNLNISFDDFFDDFIEGKIDKYGSWYENVGSWIGAKEEDHDKFLIIRYEDLLIDTLSELKKVTKFLNVKISDEKIKNAIKNSRLEKLKKAEEFYLDKSTGIKTDSNIPFFRKGKSGQWNNLLSGNQQDIIWNKMGHLMKKLGYK